MKRITSISLILVALLALVGCAPKIPMPASGKVEGTTSYSLMPKSMNATPIDGTGAPSWTHNVNVSFVYAAGAGGEVMYDKLTGAFSVVSEPSEAIQSLQLISDFGTSGTIDLFPTSPDKITLFSPQSVREEGADNWDPEKTYQKFFTTLYFRWLRFDISSGTGPGSNKAVIYIVPGNDREATIATIKKVESNYWDGSYDIHVYPVYTGIGVGNTLLPKMDVPYDKEGVTYTYVFDFNADAIGDVWFNTPTYEDESGTPVGELVTEGAVSYSYNDNWLYVARYER